MDKAKVEFFESLKWFKVGFDVMTMFASVMYALINDLSRGVNEVIGFERFVALYFVVMLVMFSMPRWVAVAELMLAVALNAFLFVVFIMLYTKWVEPEHFKFMWKAWFK